MQSAQKATEFGKIKQPLGLLRCSRSFEVTDFGTNLKLICDLPEVLPREWDDLRKIFIERSPVAKISNGVEILQKISIAWVRCMNVTDDRRQADEETDWRTTTYTFTFAKNLTSKPVFVFRGTVNHKAQLPKRQSVPVLASASISATDFGTNRKPVCHSLTYILSRTISKLSWSISQLLVYFKAVSFYTCSCMVNTWT